MQLNHYRSPLLFGLAIACAATVFHLSRGVHGFAGGKVASASAPGKFAESGGIRLTSDPATGCAVGPAGTDEQDAMRANLAAVRDRAPDGATLGYLSSLYGERWQEVSSGIEVGRLEKIAELDLASLPRWHDVCDDVRTAGLNQTHSQRGYWPLHEGDGWLDVDGIDFRRRAFNPRGRQLTDRDLEVLRDIVRQYNDEIRLEAAAFWDDLEIAYLEFFHGGFTDPLPDLNYLPGMPGMPGLESLTWMPPGGGSVLASVHAAASGWVVDVPMKRSDHPQLAERLDRIEDLERERLERVQEEIEDRGDDR